MIGCGMPCAGWFVTNESACASHVASSYQRRAKLTLASSLPGEAAGTREHVNEMCVHVHVCVCVRAHVRVVVAVG